MAPTEVPMLDTGECASSPYAPVPRSTQHMNKIDLYIAYFNVMIKSIKSNIC
jgi:hypothetical protein